MKPQTYDELAAERDRLDVELAGSVACVAALKREVARLTADLEHINAVCTHKTQAHERAVEREQAVLAERNRLTAELAEAQALSEQRREAASSLLDAIAVPAGHPFVSAWDRACLMFGQYASVPTLFNAEREAHAKTDVELNMAAYNRDVARKERDRAEAVLRGLRAEAERKGWAEVVWKLDELERA